MAFADLKNDFVFRRIFATHPANKATFTQTELDAYQKVIDEINQARELAEARWEEGHKGGLAEGLAMGKRAALVRLLARRGITLTEEEQRKISLCEDLAWLDQWFDNALTGNTAAEILA